MNRREYLRNWWDLSRGGNVVWGIATIGLGALMIGVDYEESILSLALHALSVVGSDPNAFGDSYASAGFDTDVAMIPNASIV